MAIALILITALASYIVYHNDIVGLVRSLPDSNDDFVFAGDATAAEGKIAVEVSPVVAPAH
jgi:hypothetical protein